VKFVESVAIGTRDLISMLGGLDPATYCHYLIALQQFSHVL